MKDILLTDFSFRTTENNLHPYSNQLFIYAKTNKYFYELILNYFMLAPNRINIADNPTKVAEDLEFERLNIEIHHQKFLNSSIFRSVVILVESMNRETDEAYKKILSEFQELIVSSWCNKRNIFDKTYHEPTIFLNNGIIFKRKKYRKSKCDFVCLNYPNNLFHAYECKLTTRSLYNALKCRNMNQRKRQINYIFGLKKLLETKVKNINCDIFVVTLLEENLHDVLKDSQMNFIFLPNITFECIN